MVLKGKNIVDKTTFRLLTSQKCCAFFRKKTSTHEERYVYCKKSNREETKEF